MRFLRHRSVVVLVGLVVVTPLAGCGDDVATQSEFITKMDSISTMKSIKWDCIYDKLKVDHASAIADLMDSPGGGQMAPGLSALVSPFIAECAGMLVPLPTSSTTTTTPVGPSTTSAPTG